MMNSLKTEISAIGPAGYMLERFRDYALGSREIYVLKHQMEHPSRKICSKNVTRKMSKRIITF